MNEDFGSISDIDAKLDAEFGVDANTTEEVVVDDKNVSDDSVDETTDGTVETQEPTTNEEEEPQEEKTSNVNDDNVEPTADGKDSPKDHHAFADLRVQNSNLKKEKEALEADSKFLKDLAASYGYTDVNAFQKAIKDARMQKEAEAKGYDFELYRHTNPPFGASQPSGYELLENPFPLS